MSENNTPTPETAQDSGKSGFRRVIAALDNFWYHNKFATVVVVFLLIVGIVCTVQFCEKSSYDAHILYAGPWFECDDGSYVTYIEDAFEHCLEDFDGDGKKNIAYRPIWIMNDSQIAALKEQYKDNPENMPFVNTTLLANNTELLNSELMTGETVICLLDPTIFASLWQDGWTQPLTDFVSADELPDNPYDDHGIFLKDIDFGQYFTGLRNMPEDTVLCIRRTSVLTNIWAPDESARVKENNVKLFLNILRFRTPEET